MVVFFETQPSLALQHYIIITTGHLYLLTIPSETAMFALTITNGGNSNSIGGDMEQFGFLAIIRWNNSWD